MRLNYLLTSFCLVALGVYARPDIEIHKEITSPGLTPPIYVSLSGFTGEASQVLHFDLYVQGFAFTNAEAAQYLISGSNNGNLEGKVIDNVTKTTVVQPKAYSGAALRRQAHAFVDDFVQALGRKPICQTKVAFKGENNRHSEIYVSDFDGHDAQPITKDNSIVAGPCWVPHHLAVLYVSYTLGNPTIFFHNVATGERKAFAHYNGSNFSPAVSPDDSKVAMILDKDGWTDLYVCDSDGTGLKRLTRSPQDESSPCWSPDGRWICYAAKDGERRTLKKISPSGGAPQPIPTSGMPSPSEPDWSSDGQWIAFTVQHGNSFGICVVPTKGGPATELVSGEDPTWAPNSRTLMYGRRQAGHYVLCLLDVPTKQYKDVSRLPGISSQSQPSWAR